MSISRTLIALALSAALSGASLSAAPPDKGGGKGGGGGNPTGDFVPAIGYKYSGRNYTEIQLANRAGDQACTVLRLADGSPSLRGFSFDAARGRLAYGLGGHAIYVVDLVYQDNKPCPIATEENTVLITPIVSANPEHLDFSPNGKYLVWTENDESYSGFGTSRNIAVYEVTAVPGTAPRLLDLSGWGGSRADWGVNGEWAVSSTRFNPDFESSNEILFTGAPLDGSQGAYSSLYAYNLNEQTPPRQILDGAGFYFDDIVTVTNPHAGGTHRLAFTDNDTGNILQVRLADGKIVQSFAGYEPAYSCDNAELINRSSAAGAKNQIRITSADGGTSENWSRANIRFFDWFCP